MAPTIGITFSVTRTSLCAIYTSTWKRSVLTCGRHHQPPRARDVTSTISTRRPRTMTGKAARLGYGDWLERIISPKERGRDRKEAHT